MTLAILRGTPVRTKPYQVLPPLGDEEKKQIQEVLDSGVLSGFVGMPGEFFLGGKKVRELEKLFQDYFNIPHAVSMNSATSGLHAALAAVGIKGGDEVLCTPYTMSATAAAILMQNAIPVFVDIDLNTFCMDPKKIEAAITPRTKAILVVHLFGLPADLDPILKIAKKHKLYVVEDCAQSPGALYKGKKAGTLGDIGIFSLNQHKVITTGEGGVCITRNPDFAFNMQLVRNHGEVVLAEMKEHKPNQALDLIGWNYRMNELDAAVGVAQFKRLDTLTQERIVLANYLTSGLEKITGIQVPSRNPDKQHVFFSYPIKFDEKVWGVSRSIFLEALKAEGIPCAGGYVKPIYQQPIYQRKQADAFRLASGPIPSYQRGICPVTERMHEKELITLPIIRTPHMAADIQEAVQAFEKLWEHREELIAYSQKKEKNKT